MRGSTSLNVFLGYDWTYHQAEVGSKERSKGKGYNSNDNKLDITHGRIPCIELSYHQARAASSSRSRFPRWSLLAVSMLPLHSAVTTRPKECIAP